MLNFLKTHWRSWLVTLLGIAIALLIVWFSDAFQQCMNKSYYESSDYEPEKGIAFVLSAFGWTKVCTGEFLKADGEAITAFFTLVVGAFTAALWFSTDKLWRSGERQIKTSRQIAAIQAYQTRVSNRDTTRSANAAVESAEHLPRIERAYIFATPTPRIEDSQTIIELALENVGQTPGFIRQGYGATALHEPTGIPAYPPGEGNPRILHEAFLRPGGASPFPTRWFSHTTETHYCFGYIKYADIFKNEHTSRFCVKVFPSEGKIDSAGPPAWNEWD